MTGLKYYKEYEVVCLDCNCLFIADDTHHCMDYCPICNKNAVDIETYGQRMIGHIKILGEVEDGKKE